ncbi:MAG: hypothetical protein MZW92_09745 [Comamonadaceae bacterium]|nr:hypothetical protein [Comamonadaceae bacterium]
MELRHRAADRRAGRHRARAAQGASTDEQTIGGLRTFILFAADRRARRRGSRCALDTPWMLIAAALIGGRWRRCSPATSSSARLSPTRSASPPRLGRGGRLPARWRMTTLGYRELGGRRSASRSRRCWPTSSRCTAWCGKLDTRRPLRRPAAADRHVHRAAAAAGRADRPVGRAAIRYSLWLLVLLISGLSLVGYVATRLAGRRVAASRSPASPAAWCPRLPSR